MIWAQALALAALVAAPEAPPYTWPLGLPRTVTSSFGEYRFGRFHAGMDLHTGAIGRPVHAPADGHVARVSCSPWGFGKALYLQLRDGNTVVFGHLDNFAPAIRDYVRKIQHERKSYTVDLTPDPSTFPVEQGDVVAFSGDTGIGPAHLHYEIHDAQGCPANPCLLGAAWPDPDRPVIRKLLVVPAAGSTVNGDLLPKVFPTRAAGAGEYTCAALRASGSIGIGIDVVDPANGGGSKLGVYRVRTIVNSKEIFRIQMDRFRMENRFNETVSYYPFPLEQEGDPFLLQWRWPGNDCEIIGNAKSDGWITVPARPAEIRIEVEDFQGNKAALSVPVQPEAESSKKIPGKTGAGKGTVDVTCVGTWLMVTARFSAPEDQTPEIEVEGGLSHEGGFRRINESTFRSPVTPKSDAEELVLRVRHDRIPSFEQRIHVFHLGAPERSITLDGTAVTVKPKSPWGTLYVRALSPEALAGSALPMRGKAIRLWPSAMPIDEPIAITLPAPQGRSASRKLGVYRYTGEYWGFEGPVSTDGTATVSTRRLGAFAILEDDRLPSVSNIVFEKGMTSATKRPKIGAAVSDVGSGIENTNVTCNGQWLLFAYDPESGRISWERDEDLPPGPKEFVFTVTDKAGNSSSVTRKIGSETPKSTASKSSTAKPASAKPGAAKGRPVKTQQPSRNKKQ